MASCPSKAGSPLACRPSIPTPQSDGYEIVLTRKSDVVITRRYVRVSIVVRRSLEEVYICLEHMYPDLALANSLQD